MVGEIIDMKHGSARTTKEDAAVATPASWLAMSSSEIMIRSSNVSRQNIILKLDSARIRQLPETRQSLRSCLPREFQLRNNDPKQQLITTEHHSETGFCEDDAGGRGRLKQPSPHDPMKL